MYNLDRLSNIQSHMQPAEPYFWHYCAKLGIFICKCNYHFHTLDQRNSRGQISHVYLTTGIHLNVHWCIFRCTPGEWLHFLRSKPLLVFTCLFSKNNLRWEFIFQGKGLTPKTKPLQKLPDNRCYPLISLHWSILHIHHRNQACLNCALRFYHCQYAGIIHKLVILSVQ